MREHDAQQAQCFFGGNRDVVKCLDDNPNLFINSINCLLLKELLPDKLLENLTNTQNNFIDLCITQHLNKGFFKILEDQRVAGFGLLCK